MMNKNRMPALFLAHGSPMNIIERNTFTEALSTLSGSPPQPKGSIVISAHWQTRGTQVTCTRQPRTMHDFSGFPDEPYDIGYPCPGSPEMAEGVRASCHVTWNMAWTMAHGLFCTTCIPWRSPP
jgi:4,5-DOPA dioxygenase extradiol